MAQSIVDQVAQEDIKQLKKYIKLQQIQIKEIEERITKTDDSFKNLASQNQASVSQASIDQIHTKINQFVLTKDFQHVVQSQNKQIESIKFTLSDCVKTH